MKDEIAAAVVFISHLAKQNENLTKEKLEKFSECLTEILVEKFKNHWYKEQPNKGQGFRCIRVNETEPTDPVLAKAAEETGLKYEDLKLPVEMTLWVDPSEVACRFGESKGSYCTVASFKDDDKENKSTKFNLEEIIQKTQNSKNNTNKGPYKAYRSNKKNDYIHNNNRNNFKNAYHYTGPHHFDPSVPPPSGQHSPNFKQFQPHQKQFPGYRPPQRPKPFHHQKNGGHGFQQNNKGDRFHWVRGADLVKA